MTSRFAFVVAACALGAWLPSSSLASEPSQGPPQPRTYRRRGRFRRAGRRSRPIGPPPCLQTRGIGGPADPCAYLLHHLTPEEVTIQKGGQVTFQIHGGGHGFALYEVSPDTTRNELGQFLCAGTDPQTIEAAANHQCNLLRGQCQRPSRRARRT